MLNAAAGREKYPTYGFEDNGLDKNEPYCWGYPIYIDVDRNGVEGGGGTIDKSDELVELQVVQVIEAAVMEVTGVGNARFGVDAGNSAARCRFSLSFTFPSPLSFASATRF